MTRRTGDGLPLSLRDISIDESPETLQLCFPGDRNSLKSLDVWSSPSLKSLRLDSCTALEELKITGCESLDTLEGLQSLAGLRFLKVSSCPGLRLSLEGYELCSRLDTPFCIRLTSLKRLKIFGVDDEWEEEEKVTTLTDEQERSLQHLTSLQVLGFSDWQDLRDLPVGLRSLSSLRKLKIYKCPCITGLPEQVLPPSLEKLMIKECEYKLNDQCRMLATSKLRVKIDGEYVE
ncbi:hypothetical protein EJB05_38340, partial [Eragrostis curvula]